MRLERIVEVSRPPPAPEFTPLRHGRVQEVGLRSLLPERPAPAEASTPAPIGEAPPRRPSASKRPESNESVTGPNRRHFAEVRTSPSASGAFTSYRGDWGWGPAPGRSTCRFTRPSPKQFYRRGARPRLPAQALDASRAV